MSSLDQESPSHHPSYRQFINERNPARAEPPFESPEMQDRVWGRVWGVTNDVSQLKLCALHTPGTEMEIIDSQKFDPDIQAFVDDREAWYWRSTQPPDLTRFNAEHDGLRQALIAEGVGLVEVTGSQFDSQGVFARDMAVAINGGAIICRLGSVGVKAGYGRRGEESHITKALAAIGMPIIHTIAGAGLLEGGSVCFLNEHTAAVGMSYRQNEEGTRQLEEALAIVGIRLIRISMTGYSAHLDGCFVMVDHDKAILDVTQLPYWFLDKLKELGIEQIRCWPGEERAINCLAVRPGRVLIPADCVRSIDRLNQRGVETVALEYDEVLKAGGGIHCSTLPLVRARE